MLRLLKPALKLAISAALIALVVHAFELRGVAAHFGKVDALTIAAMILLALSIALLHAMRWLSVVRAAGEQSLAYAAALRIVLIGHFFNQVLPSSVGGDAVRVWCAYRAGLPFASAASTVIVDRAMALFALLLYTAAVLPIVFQIVDTVAAWALATVTAGGLLGFAVFVLLPALPSSFSRWKVLQALIAVASLARKVFARPRYAFNVIVLSILSFAIFGFILYALARSMHIDVALVHCLVLLPPVILVTVVPISIAGWGLREGAMVIAFGYVSVPADAAFAISVLFGLTLAAASLPGSVLWLLSGHSLRNVAASVRSAPVQER